MNMAVVSASPAVTSASAYAQASPRANVANLIWLMSDSFDGRFLDPGSAQWAQVHLPNLRSLADSGTNYVRTYANSPQCVPSRTSMMMGRHTHHIGAWNNGMGLAHRFNPSFVAPPGWCETAMNRTDCELRRAINEAHGRDNLGKVDAACHSSWNYTTCRHMAHVWQSNVSSATPDVLRALRDAGVDVRVYGKVDIGFGLLDEFPNATVGGFHGGPTMSIQTRSADIRGPTKPDPRSITQTDDDHVHPEDWKTVEMCIEWLGGHDPKESGWLLHCSINIPHPPFNTNATWLAYVNESAVGVPRSFTELGGMHPADAYTAVSKHVDGSFNDSEIVRIRAVYAAMCAETDYLLGRVLDAAKRTGHLGERSPNTYVLFLSDHGEMAMEHRQVWKNSMYEGSSRVPMILSGPGVAAGRTSRALTQLLDVYPTLLSIFGVRPAVAGVGLDGASLLRSSDGAANDDGARRFVVSQYHSNMVNTGTFMVRTSDGLKYVAFGTSARGLESPSGGYTPQLFDVERDPDELINLASNGSRDLTPFAAMLRSVVGDPQEVDATAKDVDHWLYLQWYVLAGHGYKPTLQETWKKAYDAADWASARWEIEWRKAKKWMEL